MRKLNWFLVVGGIVWLIPLVMKCLSDPRDAPWWVFAILGLLWEEVFVTFSLLGYIAFKKY